MMTCQWGSGRALSAPAGRLQLLERQALTPRNFGLALGDGGLILGSQWLIIPRHAWEQRPSWSPPRPSRDPAKGRSDRKRHRAPDAGELRIGSSPVHDCPPGGCRPPRDGSIPPLAQFRAVAHRKGGCPTHPDERLHPVGLGWSAASMRVSRPPRGALGEGGAICRLRTPAISAVPTSRFTRQAWTSAQVPPIAREPWRSRSKARTGGAQVGDFIRANFQLRVRWSPPESPSQAGHSDSTRRSRSSTGPEPCASRNARSGASRLTGVGP